ncbi:MAG: sulfatase [Acidobacteriota bacterium]|nr:sulfatase [Acidobacteriota bacterium]
MRPVRKQRSRLALLLIVGALAGCEHSSSSRHLVLVVFDTLRADRTSLYGYQRPTTPFLEELARESVVYLDVKAPGSWTVPSHASLFTGLWPGDHHAQWGSMRLDEGFETLAEILSAEGFCTTGLSANALAGPKTGLAQGFDEFRVISGDWPEKTTKILSALEDVVEDVKRRNCRLFLFVNLMDAHIPFNSQRHARDFGLRGPGPVRNARIKWEINDGQRTLDPEQKAQHGAAYDAAVRTLDDAARELVSVLVERGMAQQTVLVMTSDHGEGLGAHPEIGHSISVWEEQLAVPLLVRRPGDRNAGKSIAGRRSLVTLTPSLLDWLGVPRPDHLSEAPGIDIEQQPVAADYRSYFREADRRTNLRMAETYPRLAGHIVDQHVVYCGRYKLRLAANGGVSWFDLERDPTEQNDLAATGDSRADLAACRQEHRKLLAAGHLTRLGAETPVDDPATALDLETLRGLGYVQ